MPRMGGNKSGFTLLELMLALALIGVLGAIALPSYHNVVDRANRNQAIADIGQLSLKLYRYQTNRGAFPGDLNGAGAGDWFDPWGRPYVYLDLTNAKKGKARKDKNLNPINTDFDLYSVGRDGRSSAALTAKASRDDIIRANNGTFIGLAADY